MHCQSCTRLLYLFTHYHYVMLKGNGINKAYNIRAYVVSSLLHIINMRRNGLWKKCVFNLRVQHYSSGQDFSIRMLIVIHYARIYKSIHLRCILRHHTPTFWPLARKVQLLIAVVVVPLALVTIDEHTPAQSCTVTVVRLTRGPVGEAHSSLVIPLETRTYTNQPPYKLYMG